MNPNGRVYRILTIILGTTLMSYAWPLRGQFGHAWGALVPGAAAALIACALIPWKVYRQGTVKAVFFGAFGFAVGGENLPFGALIRSILSQPDLAAALPGLLTILFIGASWGCIGGFYLGYGMSEKPMTARDYAVLFGAGIAAFIPLYSINSNGFIILVITVLILVLLLYNLLFKRSGIVTLFGVYGLTGFGLGFAGSVVILFCGTKGLLPGPPGWWTLRDQIWGTAGGVSIILAAWKACGCGYQPAVTFQPALEKAGFVFFVPLICGWNTYDVYDKWFHSSPPAPNLALAGLLLAGGVLLLTGWTIYYLTVPASRLVSPALNSLLLASLIFFFLYLTFLAIAKSIVYGGWGAWETGFTMFLFQALLAALTLPLILLGRQNS